MNRMFIHFSNDITLVYIQHRKDWYSVTTKQFQSAGGRRLLTQFGSIMNILTSVYPEYPDPY